MPTGNGRFRQAQDELLPQLQAHLLSLDVTIPPWDADQAQRDRFRARAAQGLVEIGAGLRDGEIQPTAARLAEMMTGIGALTPLLSEPGIEEIVVRQGHVQIERYGRFEDLGALADDAHFEQVARRVADRGRRSMKADRPYVLVDLPDGSRFTAIIPPLSTKGTAINIRVFRRDAMDFEALAKTGTFSPTFVGTQADSASEPSALLAGDARLDPDHTAGLDPAASTSTSTSTSEALNEALNAGLDRKAIQSGLDVGADPAQGMADFLSMVTETNAATVLFSGEFGSGKTTLMNAASLYLPHTLQVAVLETFEELQLAHPHAVRAVVPPDRDNFPSLSEVVNVVYTRMRPDLLIIGEIVRDEAARFLDAINLGKKAWSTIHGNSALGALYRLETKALSSGLPHQAIREQVAAGVELVVHMRKDGPRRYIEQIVAVEDRLASDGNYQLVTLYDARTRAISTAERLAQLSREAGMARQTGMAAVR